MSLSPKNTLQIHFGSVRVVKMFIWYHTLQGIQMNDPSSGMDFRRSISHDKCNIITWLCTVGIHLATWNGFVRVKKLPLRCHMLQGPRIIDPSSSGGFKRPISHDKCKIIIQPCDVGIHFAFDLTISSKVSQLTTIVAPRGVNAPLVVVKRARLAW